MAVDKKKQPASGGPHWAVGLNVTLTTILAVALVAGLQWLAYSYSTRADLTTSGVNSLTEPTKNLLRDLSGDVKLTSMYFTTDLENEDQDRFRSTVADLLELYRASNRGKISTETINPLQDHERRKDVFKRLAELDTFKTEAAGHEDAIAVFRDQMLRSITELIAAELSQLEALGTVEGQSAQLVAQVRQLFAGVQSELERSSLDIDDALASELPAHSAAAAAIGQAYGGMIGLLKSVNSVGEQLAAAPGQFPPNVAAFFIEAPSRYATLLSELEAANATVQTLPALAIDDLLRDLSDETGNPILVEAGGSAKVLAFRDVWPPIDPRAAGGFGNHRFLGEQKLTSAVLQLTEKEKPAVVFIRFGGPPLLFGGFMPGQPQAVLARMKEQLEDANFSVHEWDLASQDTMPEIDPPASRTLFVLMRPYPPQRGPFGQPPQQPSFSPANLETVKQALGENPRALFLAGWMPGAGPMATGYEYADYLRSEWGIDADCSRLLFAAEPVGPEKFRIMRHPLQLTEVRFGDHPLVEGLAASSVILPLVAPIEAAEETPEGVELDRLAWFDTNDGLWSIGDVDFYQKQLGNEFIVRNAADYSGEFTAAYAATKGDSKIVVISASDFAVDQVAMASDMVLTAQGLAVRQRNPGNAALFINALHWLNDNTAWMNLGTPIDNAALAVDKDSSSMTFVRVLVLAIWPGLAALCGVCVWAVRRR